VSRALYMLRTCKNFLTENSLKTLYYSMVHTSLSLSLWQSHLGMRKWKCKSRLVS